MAHRNTAREQVVKYSSDGFVETEDDIAVEFPLTMMLNGEEFATIVCTPSDLEDLVVGFWAAEGVVRSPAHIRSLVVNEREGFAYVETKAQPTLAKQDYMRRFIGSCCGKSRHFYFASDAKTAKTITSQHTISAADCFYYMELLNAHSTAFKMTGGVHNAVLCDEAGVIVARTDIGRHNALDKIYGHCLTHDIPVRDKLIAFSGRVSSEVLLKLSKMGIGVLLSKSAPTDLAIQLAKELNVTVVGFIRGGSFNVYTHPQRIKGLKSPRTVQST